MVKMEEEAMMRNGGKREQGGKSSRSVVQGSLGSMGHRQASREGSQQRELSQAMQSH